MANKCRNKVQYPNKPVARKSIKRVERSGRVAKGRLGAYYCNLCRNYHIGHRPQRQIALSHNFETIDSWISGIVEDIWRAIQKL